LAYTTGARGASKLRIADLLSRRPVNSDVRGTGGLSDFEIPDRPSPQNIDKAIESLYIDSGACHCDKSEYLLMEVVYDICIIVVGNPHSANFGSNTRRQYGNAGGLAHQQAEFVL
jgi:hypothetical protein